MRGWEIPPLPGEDLSSSSITKPPSAKPVSSPLPWQTFFLSPYLLKNPESLNPSGSESNLFPSLPPDPIPKSPAGIHLPRFIHPSLKNQIRQDLLFLGWTRWKAAGGGGGKKPLCFSAFSLPTYKIITTFMPFPNNIFIYHLFHLHLFI